MQDHEAVVDESAMTGESLPVTIAAGANVRSGITNAGEPFEVLATRRADESSYAALVRLVQAAESERAPFVRLADRYAVWFLGVTRRAGGRRVGRERRPGPRGRRARDRDARAR